MTVRTEYDRDCSLDREREWEPPQESPRRCAVCGYVLHADGCPEMDDDYTEGDEQ
jgi:hypothetical protein